MSVESPHAMHSAAAFPVSEDEAKVTQMQQAQVHRGTALKDWMLTSHHLEGLSSDNHISIPHPSSPLKSTHTTDPANVVSPKEKTLSSSHEAVVSPPPVVEIRISTPKTVASNSDDDDFETLYLCSRRDLHLAHKENDALAEENRLLKRHMIQLQKQLYSIRRSSQKRNVSWSVPSPKRLRACNPQASR